MYLLRPVGRGLLVSALLMLAAAPVVAADGRQAGATGQQASQADIQRLQEIVYDVGTDISRLRSRDANRAEQLQERLDSLRDEVTYLKVKARKEGVARSEYSTLRADLDDLRADARTAMSGGAMEPGRAGVGGTLPEEPSAGSRQQGTTRPAEPAAREDEAPPVRQQSPQKTSRPDEAPAGTELDVRLDNALSSETAQVEDRFTATTVADLYNGDRLLIPAGSSVRGVVTSVNKAGRVERTGKLTLSFDRVTVKGRSHPMHATVTEALQSGGYRQDAGKIGAGAGVGAIIGGILGGLRGALAGILIGGGGVVAATEGQDVNLPAGTVLRIRLDSPLSVR